jgi:hypothetical protein
VGNGGYSEGFSNTISGWKKGPLVTISKVRAHPEKFKHHTAWDWDDKGIWTADRVAGREMEFEGRVKASQWLKRIGNRSALVIEEADGTPFIGNVRDRASRINMQNYWKERDGWRTVDGLDPKWEGTNIAMAFSLLMRNGSLEDYATMQRLAASKRWEYSRHNHIVCKACLGDFRGQRHPLLGCNNLAMGIARKTWLDNCRAYISTAKPEKLRPKMLEILHHATKTEGGEYACVGTFIPGWVAHLEDRVILNQFELRAIKKFMRVIASGARLVMREYARLKEVSEGGSRELRQLSISQFTDKPVAFKEPKIKVGKPVKGNAPPDNAWRPTTQTQGKKLRWSLQIQSALIMDGLIGIQASGGPNQRNLNLSGSKETPRSPFPPMGPIPERTIAKGRMKSKASFPWKGLNWFNLPIAPSLGGKPTITRPKVARGVRTSIHP